jgi:hypothetical protein
MDAQEKLNQPADENVNHRQDEDSETVTVTDTEINSEPITEPSEIQEAEMPEPVEAVDNSAEETPAELDQQPSLDVIEQPLETATPDHVVEIEQNLSQEFEVQSPDLSVDPGSMDVATEEIQETEEEESEDAETVVHQMADTEEDYDNYTREQLLSAMEVLVQEPDINVVKNKVSLVKVAYYKLSRAEKQSEYNLFIEKGGKKEEYIPSEDEIDQQFNAAFNIYKEKKAKYNEDLEEEKLKNLEIKKQILEDLKNLINSEETLKETYDDFKVLQVKWKDTGMVPKTEINTLWQNYHFLVEKFFDKVKINKELKDLDLKKNLESKMAICEKADELLLETSIAKSFKALQKLHDEWKEIGPVPQDKKDEIWERFKNTTDKINERRREFYGKLQEQQQNNFIAKTVLCEKAEAILTTEATTVKEWQTKTNEMNELLKIWKTIGPAQLKLNNEIWQRFRNSLETFYSTKKEYNGKIKDEQMNNYNLKVDLCVQAEALKTSTDWAKTTRELIALQKEWKNTGILPHKISEKIWKRFRSACDEFFNNKTAFFSNVNIHEGENLQLKLDLIKLAEEYVFTNDRNKDLENLKDFQRQWMEIGHVPLAEKDKLQTQFRTVINKHFDKLKANSYEMGANNYKNKLESFKNAPDANRLITKEKNFITSKITQLQEDILLWENNIGYLAKSPNATLLKEEFDKKINSAKREVQVLEEKLKFLRNSIS